jgi:radical SAM protein with 4Fe4S-binding SPASM domain
MSARFLPRAARFARRKARGLLSAGVQRLFGVAMAGSPRLSKYILSEWLHELDEFRFPAGLHVALTKKCNLRCIMCPYHAEELRAQHTTGYFDEAERMPAALLDKIIEETGRYGGNLGFGEYDEPFIYKGFAGWAAKAKRAGCTVSITTNGTLLPEKDARTLLVAGVEHISFSLDAASHETYSRIRLDDFSIPLENLKRLVRLRNEGGYRTEIRACMVLQEHNRHEKDAFFELMKSIGVDMVSFYNLSILDQGVWKMSVLNFDVDADAPGERNVCSQLYNQMAVYPDGRVALCCLTTMYVGYRTDVPYVGNVKNSSLREIWISPEYNRIRAEAFDRKFSNSVCRDCTIWHNYQGREVVDGNGLKQYKNAYETFVYLR